MILDTNALSAIAEGDAAIEPLLRHASEIAIPVIVLGEYRYGIERSRHKASYEAWLQSLVEQCRVLDVDLGTATHYAELRVMLKVAGQPIPANDLWIAALARQHGLAILTRDAHFDAVEGVQRVTW